MKARNQKIVMPEKSRVMTQEEMEYEGGFLNFVVGLTASAVSIGATILGATGVVDKKYTSKISKVCDGVSILTMGIGAGTLVRATYYASKSVSTFKQVAYSAGRFRVTNLNSWDEVGNGLAGGVSDLCSYTLGKAVNAATSR